MKKTLIKLSALATIGLVMASCSNEEANKKAVDADNAAIQSLVDTKIQAIDAEVAAECDAKVAAAAQLVVDSLENAAKKGGAKAPAKKPVAKAPVKKAEEKKPATKADKMGGNTSTTNTQADKASKMGGTAAPAGNTQKDKASRMGGN